MPLKPYVIAEVGCVHLGNMERATTLIDLAADAGADCVKFQKRNPIESVPLHLQNKPHENPEFAYGNTYLEHRQNLELDTTQHKELKEYCESKNVDYSTSVWDITSAKEIIQLNPKFIKVPSACNMSWDLLTLLFEEYDGDIHISLGMTDREDRETIDAFLEIYKTRIVVYHCTSAYPCPFEKLFLMEIPQLVKKYERVGFSNHGKGIASDIAALALGSWYFERHFVDDRTLAHTDAAASLEPQGLQKLVRDLHNIKNALGSKPMNLDPLELKQRTKLKGD
jgi:sialic acid synthase